MAILAGILTVVFVLAAIFLVLLVLVQPPHSDGGSGLAGAFIGVGGDSFFGTRAMTMAGKLTIFLAVLLVALAVTINKIGPAKKSKSLLDTGESTTPAEPPAENPK
jgi:protein translocase SecG subunit